MATGPLFLNDGGRSCFALASDTRRSGKSLGDALARGFSSVGMKVLHAGCTTTPALAQLTRKLGIPGVMISASHNPYEDNGFKVFGRNGYKLPDQTERYIEERIAQDLSSDVVCGSRVGKIKTLKTAERDYIESLKQSLPVGFSLDGMRIVVDCANGAAYKIVMRILKELGATVYAIGVRPNGTNINDGVGSTHPEKAIAAVLKHRAHIGLCFDGDADRLIVINEKGEIVDGDQLIALIALSLHSKGKLAVPKVIATIMSNLGMKHHLANHGISLIQTDVGDRNVLKKMLETGSNVGGEQSGHIILSDHASTGDGLLAALQVLAVIRQRGGTASEVCRCFDPWPQVKKDFEFGNSNPLESERVKQAIRVGENWLEGEGQVLLRKSGTQRLVRLMVQGRDEDVVHFLVNKICKQMKLAA